MKKTSVLVFLSFMLCFTGCTPTTSTSILDANAPAPLNLFDILPADLYFGMYKNETIELLGDPTDPGDYINWYDSLEVQSFESSIGLSFTGDKSDLKGLRYMFSPNFFLSPDKDKLYSTIKSQLTQDYGGFTSASGSALTWDVGNEKIELEILSDMIITVSQEYISDKDSTKEANIASTADGDASVADESVKVSIPLELTSAYLEKDVIGTSELNIRAKNTSSYTIDALTVQAELYNNYDEPVYEYGSSFGGNVFRGISQESITPDSTYGKDTYWSLYGFDGATKAKVTIVKMHATDGTIWDLEPSQYVYVDAKMK